MVSMGLWAAPGEELEGSWVLEPQRSAPMEPLLAAMGVPWLERQAAARIVPEQDIAVAADGKAVTITSRVPTSAQSTLVVDGVQRPSQGMAGFHTARHSWEVDGGLVSVLNGQAPDGAPMTAVIRRGVDQTGALVQEIYLEVARTELHTVRVSRVFTRR